MLHEIFDIFVLLKQKLFVSLKRFSPCVQTNIKIMY